MTRKAIPRDFNTFQGRKWLEEIARRALFAADTGWTDPSNYVETKTFDANATSLNETADVLATLIVKLKAAGVLDD